MIHGWDFYGYRRKTHAKQWTFYNMDHSSMESIKDERYSIAIVPKDVDVSDLTVTSRVTCSNTVPLNTPQCSILGAQAQYRPAHITAFHQ